MAKLAYGSDREVRQADKENLPVDAGRDCHSSRVDKPPLHRVLAVEPAHSLHASACLMRSPLIGAMCLEEGVSREVPLGER